MSDDVQSGFQQFNLGDALNTAIENLGFEEPTPIQREAIPILQSGRDMIGGARTGSGKTAAFGIPLLQRVSGGGSVRALILAPTRELAMQVSAALASFARHMRLDVLTIYGGASYQTQLRGIKRGCTVVVGTPGRVIDLMERGSLDLSAVEFFVLDEADEMLRMGFVEDVEKVLAALPTERQIALFSATMPEQIRRLAQAYLRNPVEIQVEDEALSVGHIDQSMIRVSERDKQAALLRLLAGGPPGATLVFARTRKRCGEVAEFLISQGISADALHGDLNQGQRERVLGRLRAHGLDVVVATDVAARGIDVDHLSCVINFDIPDDAELYVHRIGRTARAGRDGIAITLIGPRDRGRIKHIQHELKVRIPEGTLPTNQEIQSLRRTELLDQISTDVDGDKPLKDVKDWLAKEIEARGWSAIDVAAAAVKRLGSELNFEFDEPPPEEQPDFTAINAVEIVVAAGRRDGIRPADIVGSLANGIGMPASQIGKISLGANRAFVGLSASAAESLLKAHKTIEVRGQQIPIEINSDGPRASTPTRSPSQSRSSKPSRSSSSSSSSSSGASRASSSRSKPSPRSTRSAPKPAAVEPTSTPTATAKPTPKPAAARAPKPAAPEKPAPKPPADAPTTPAPAKANDGATEPLRPRKKKASVTKPGSYTTKRPKRDKNKGAPGRHKKRGNTPKKKK